jgi:aminopeptidase-like protein/aminoglycoside N3'-acetyltransferase
MRGDTRVDLEDGLTRALAAVGIERGDVVFLHVDFAALGLSPEDDERWSATLLQILKSAVGDIGTLLVPTYTFSFCRREDYDPDVTPTAGGPWSPTATFLEYFRRQPGVRRSLDPIHSVAALGPAAHLVDDVAPTCFGAESVFDRLKRAGAKICLLGLPLEEATFRHHVEEFVGVPFRYRKLFTGRVRQAGTWKRRGWVYYVRILADSGFPCGERLEHEARCAGVCRSAPVGAGELLAVDASEYFSFTAERLGRDAWLTARGPAGDPVQLERDRVGAAPVPTPPLPADASMIEMVDALWRLPRDIVSSGYDAALSALGRQVPMAIHEYRSGRECWSWIIPERWQCHEAYLETLDGRRLFSYAGHPLHVVSYSLPFDGIVPRDELLRHLHVHPTLPDAVPFVFKYYDRDWGLCCTRQTRDGLHDDAYRVVIDTSFALDTLKVGEVVVPGESRETVVLCAHLCHPAMVNDDLTGVVVGVEVMRRLRRRPGLHYTYRLLIVPETIGSVAYLSDHEELIPWMKAGLFLEMLGREEPPSLQHSFAGNAEADHCFALAMAAAEPAGWTGAFRSIIGNDERQFNAPGVRIPMLSLSRVLPPEHPDWPYREYHSSADTPERVSAATLARSADLVMSMLETLERNVVPVNLFKGELFCSRFGLHVDAYANPEGHRALFDIMFLIDGTRSIAEIADACGVSFAAVSEVVDELARVGAVRLRRQGEA